MKKKLISAKLASAPTDSCIDLQIFQKLKLSPPYVKLLQVTGFVSTTFASFQEETGPAVSLHALSNGGWR